MTSEGTEPPRDSTTQARQSLACTIGWQWRTGDLGGCRWSPGPCLASGDHTHPTCSGTVYAEANRAPIWPKNERQEHRARPFVCSEIIDKRTSGREDVRLDAAKLVKTEQRQTRHKTTRLRLRRSSQLRERNRIYNTVVLLFCHPQGAWRKADGPSPRTPEAPSPAAAGEGASARENAPCWSATSCSPTD